MAERRRNTEATSYTPQTADTPGDQVQQAVGQAVDQAQQKAGQLVAQAQQRTTSRLATQKEQAAGRVETVAQALRQTGQQLRDQDQGAFAWYADRAAEQMERLSGYLHDRDVSEIIGEVEGFARRQPALFVGAAFGLGLLGARFLKSSGQ
jgi:hypothetical protein